MDSLYQAAINSAEGQAAKKFIDSSSTPLAQGAQSTTDVAIIPDVPSKVLPIEDKLKAFLTSIRPNGGHINISAISTSGAIYNTSFSMPQELGNIVEFVTRQNKKPGIGLYWTANQSAIPKDGRLAAKDIDEAEWSYVDLDPDINKHGSYELARKVLLNSVPHIIEKYRPTFIIDSGNGLGIFWRHINPLSGEEGKIKNVMLCNIFNSDTAATDVSRLMRIPYTINYPNKSKLDKGYPDEPSKSDVLYSYPDAFYAPILFKEFDNNNYNTDRLKPKASGTSNVNFRNSILPPDTDRLKSALAVIPADDYDKWCLTGMALHNEYQGSEEGFAMFHEWSMGSPKYVSEADCLVHWDSFNKDARTKDAQLSVGTIYHMAEQIDKADALESFTGELKDMKTDMVAIAERKLKGSSDTINWNSLKNSYNKSFMDAAKSKVITINPKGDLVSFSPKEFHGGIRQELFGNLTNFNSLVELAEESNPDGKPTEHAALAKNISDAINYKFKKYLSIYRQRSIIEYSTDMFAAEAKLIIAEESVKLISIHKPFPIGEINQAIINDYKEHFPELDNFLALLVAARFASDRKKAFFWLKAISDWGKGFFSSTMKELGILTEMSVKEIEAALAGTPIGKQPIDFKGCWILLVDEFKKVNSEVKQLTSSIKGSPKNQMTFEAELYMKLFTSAEEVDSLGGSGVETQFSNRFSLIPTNDYSLEHRSLFRSNGKTTYFNSVKFYIASELNKKVIEYTALGKTAAADAGDKVLEKYNHTHKLSRYYGSLDDTVDDIVNAIRDLIIRTTPNHINDQQGWNSIHNYVATHTMNVYYKESIHKLIQNVDKIISDYIDEHISPSEKGKIGFKKSQIRAFLDDSGRTNKNDPVRVTPVGETKSVIKKGVLIKV